jgi:hypothetical protein
MSNNQQNDVFRVAIPRESFLAANELLLRTIRTKTARAKVVTFYFDNQDFRFAWGDANVGVTAKGLWPKKVSIPGRDFLAIAKFPPAGDELIFEIRNMRFNCSTWSCLCNIKNMGEESYVSEEPPAAPVAKPPQPPAKCELGFAIPPTHPILSPANRGAAMTQPIRNILRDLDNIRENLLAFSDDVWLSINHNDPMALKSGTAFKEKLNTQLDAFSKLSIEITRLVREYTNIQTEGEASLETEVGATAAENTRIVKDLNRSEPHALTEDFTWKRPCGFILEGKGYRDVSTWTRIYELTLRQLARKSPDLFKSLPDNPATITRRDNRRFSTSPVNVRKPLALPNGIYAETNLSAKDLCESIRTVLEIFSLPHTSCTIFLRQDRDA